jgi:cholesterol transport system auxiliary component
VRGLIGATLTALSSLVAAALLVGCSVVADPPHQRQTFLVSLDSTGELQHSGQKPLAAVYIAPVEVAAPFSERNLVVRQSEVGYEVDPYAEFAASPGSMWTDALRSWLNRRRLFERVLPVGSSADADLTLETNLLEAVADRRAGQAPSSRLVMRFLLVQNTAPYQVLLDQTFTRVEPVKSGGAEGEVAALSRAATDVLHDFEDALPKVPN